MTSLHRRLVVIAVILVLAGLVVGCRPITATPGSVATAPAAAATAAAPELSAAEQSLVTTATEQVAQQLGVEPSAVQLVSVEAVEWPDASLGCPQPDMMYAQVITPGYRLAYTVNGKAVEAHTDNQQPPQTVICAQ